LLGGEVDLEEKNKNKKEKWAALVGGN